MSPRKPPGTSWESWIDQLIRHAREEGEFDNLPGHGKPLPDLQQPHDEMWWVRKKLREEGVSYLPPALAIRKDREDALAAIAKERSEGRVRERLEELNARIRDINRRSASGPPSTVMPVDVEAIVVEWRAQRPATGPPEPVTPLPVSEAVPKRRRFGRFRQPGG